MNRACLIHPTKEIAELHGICEEARCHGLTPYFLCDGENREALVPWSSERENRPPFLDASADLAAVLRGYEEVIFLPGSGPIALDFLRDLPPLAGPFTLQPLFPQAPDQIDQTVESVPSWVGWRADTPLALKILREPAALRSSLLQLFDAIQRWPQPPRWQSNPLSVVPAGTSLSLPPILSAASSVLAVIPFLRCEEWLHACLTSLVGQSRPPDQIVVIDDSSPVLPKRLLEPFPQVTLLSTTRNRGPEKILNNIIKMTDYDAYMVQDADDWSAHDRMALSLRAAEQTGAELVGTHEFRLNFDRNRIELALYPASVNDAMARSPGHYLLHCTSLIGRALALRIGGFQENLRLAADTDFVHRAWHRGRIVNLPAFAYFRRSRPGSLTTDPATGQKFLARTIEHRFIAIRARRALEALRAGNTADMFVHQREPVHFHFHQGPSLRLQKGVDLLRAPDATSSPAG